METQSQRSFPDAGSREGADGAAPFDGFAPVNGPLTREMTRHRLVGKPRRTPGKMDKPLQFAGLGTRQRPKKPAPSLL